MIVKYNRSALCMGDDAYNVIYRIQMPDHATVSDLISILLCGGNGNYWPIPQTSRIGWVIWSNVGRIADVSPDKKQIVCHVPDAADIAALDIEWVFGAREGEEVDAEALERRFNY